MWRHVPEIACSMELDRLKFAVEEDEPERIIWNDRNFLFQSLQKAVTIDTA